MLPASVLIADRGLGAALVQRSLSACGVRSIQIHSVPERYAAFALEASQSICVGPQSVDDSYLNAAAILDAARVTQAEAVHCGNSPLADNPDFVEAANRLGVRVLGQDAETLRHFADPVFLSSASGLLVWDPERTAGGERARHLEVPVLGNGSEVRVLANRDVSARFDERVVLSEAPAANLPDDVRKMLSGAAAALARAVGLVGLVTFEFALCGGAEREPEIVRAHARFEPALLATEALYGTDLVLLALKLGCGVSSSLELAAARVQAIVACVERDRNDAGMLSALELPESGATTTWAAPGTPLDPEYDPALLALTVIRETRELAQRTLADALDELCVGGVRTNAGLLKALLDDPVERAGELTPEYAKSVRDHAALVEVVSAGPFTLVVDHPGRLGYWHVGIPPSGAADPLAFQLVNRIVGNPSDAAGLEITLAGPTLRFTADTWIALGGAALPALLEGEPVDYYRPIRVRAGQTLEIQSGDEAGCRAYLAVRGGLDVPLYLGSRTTFTLGNFGGHRGRTLRRGDRLAIGARAPLADPQPLPAAYVPPLTRSWEVRVLVGPHAAPDFFTPHDIETLFATPWEVHFQSSRTGIRLVGPKPEWARPDGGEAGLHPSNIHDVPYAIGAIDFTGDMPILLGPDGPSLGGFVCPATVIGAELWKLGQLRPGDRVRFQAVTEEHALELERAQTELIRTLSGAPTPLPAAKSRKPSVPPSSLPAVIEEARESPNAPRVVYRRSGDHNLLVEYGPPVLDLRVRFRVHALMTWLEAQSIPGIVDLTPGIRSLQIHFDPPMLSSRRLLDLLHAAERELPSSGEIEVPSRVVHLPLSWDDPETRRAIFKYMTSVRPDAPWCPSNLEFIRRINGLDSIGDVKDIVFDANYLVLGLGDVYLGAPVATPVDPRHRLVTTKYNPARTWTPENAVGIGGAYLCVYGMEGPGGYQFVGRTVQMYNPFKRTPEFGAGTPWLLRFFDQIRFYPVSAAELLELREAFPHGKAGLRIEQSVFKLRDVERLLDEERDGIARFKRTQQAAFDAERQRWIESGQLSPRIPKDSSPIGVARGAA